MNKQLTAKEHEYVQRLRNDAMKRAWMKPRIKRLAGTWACSGRGVTATGATPSAAHSMWLITQQTQVFYALGGRVIS